MEESSIRIVRLNPSQMISTYGFGEGPESQAWDCLVTWLKDTGRLETARQERFFGFNNPNPSPGSPNYGYEQWMTVTGPIQPAGGVRLIDFMGGLYGVLHCDLMHIGEAWQSLANWRESSQYHPAYHACLEECLNPPLDGNFENLEFDLYIPIAE